jgi:mono/diheme cytochrome c family protein
MRSSFQTSAIVPLLALALASARVPAEPARAQSRPSIWAGTYTTAQADRGRTAYLDHCARCHGETAATARYPLFGAGFVDQWEERTLADLFRKISDTMPPGAVATVTDRDKIDVVAYLLQRNDFPAGDAELTTQADALAAMQIVGKTGPRPIRSGALVRAAGCLGQRNERDWQLTNATEPERTSLDPAAAASRQPPPAAPGTRTIALLNPFPSPVAHRDHRMVAVGFLVRDADGDAINVVALEMLATSCGRP